MMNKLITAMILFVFGHILIWYQTNGQFVWPWFKKNPLAVAFIFAILQNILMEHYGQEDSQDLQWVLHLLP